jgi:hypothetical protein
MTRFAIALFTALLALSAHGARYAVISLIGDEMLIVGATDATGQRIDRNQRTYVPLDDPVIDKTVLLAARDALERATGSEPVLLFGRERRLYAMQQRLMSEGKGMEGLLGYIRPLVQDTGAQYLVLFTKARREAKMQVYEQALGNGMAEGVGFYVDPSTEVLIRDKQLNATGFVSAYAFFDVALVDLSKGAIVGEQRVAANRSTAAPNTTATEVWSGISGAEKMEMLQGILREEVARTVPLLVGNPK